MLEINQIKKFCETLQTLNLWQRIFSWSNIIKSIPEIYSELKNTENLKDNFIKLEQELKETKYDFKNLQNQNIEYIKKISCYEKEKEERQNKYEENLQNLLKMNEYYEKRTIELEEQEKNKIKEKFEKMKETWKDHEIKIEEEIKRIASKYTIEYIDKESLPFPKIKPDNTIKIADEYVVFDAKSPSTDDLSAFPKTLKTQVEKLKKYAEIDGIKKDLFLIVPNNTIDLIEQTFYNLSDYNVFIITKESLEPIIICLAKIEEYEFADKLAPEERDAICRIIGRFAHITKRRLQIDNFFAKEFIRILQDSDILPENLLTKSIEYEKGCKLNPMQEKRSKQIDVKKLIDDTTKIEKEIQLQQVNINIKTTQIEEIELYEKGESYE